jgi:hypothetical protein
MNMSNKSASPTPNCGRRFARGRSLARAAVNVSAAHAELPRKHHPDKTAMKKEIPPEIRRKLANWNRIAVLHRILHVVLGLAGVLCPLVIASFADSLDTLEVRLLSFASAASVAVFAAFEVGGLAGRWRDAWKHLNAAALEFQLGLVNEEALVQAYREGEAIIGRVRENPFGEPKNIRGQGLSGHTQES